MNARSHSEDDPAPHFAGRVSLGNIITMVSGAVMLAAAWGSLQTDFRALAQRVDKGEIRDDKTVGAIDEIRNSITEIRAEQKAIRADAERFLKQLDRAVDRLDAITRVLTLPVPPPANHSKPLSPN